MKCKKCGKSITYNEMGLNKKFISRAVTEYLCKDCLSEMLKVEKSVLDEKIEQFLQAGCTMFVKE